MEKFIIEHPFWYLVIPGLVAIAGNIGFYFLFKRWIDKSIDKFKISYAGVFKQKIEIHQEILNKYYNLKSDIEWYQITGDKEQSNRVNDQFNTFLRLYQVNEPFLQQEIVDSLQAIQKKFRECFDPAYIYHESQKGLTYPMRDDKKFDNFLSASNKFRTGEFEKLERLLVSQMRKDLGTDD